VNDDCGCIARRAQVDVLLRSISICLAAAASTLALFGVKAQLHTVNLPKFVATLFQLAA
jgi:hypothetical protein